MLRLHPGALALIPCGFCSAGGTFGSYETWTVASFSDPILSVNFAFSQRPAGRSACQFGHGTDPGCDFIFRIAGIAIDFESVVDQLPAHFLKLFFQHIHGPAKMLI